MSQGGPEPRPVDEEDEVFVDAITSPPAKPTPQTETPPLRRSTRKRKSVSDVETATKTTGKRPRPLGRMQRTPDVTGKKAGQPQASRGASPDLPRREELTVTTDPPSKQTPEQVLLLGGLRSVLREELQKTEERLSVRLNYVEESILAVKTDIRTLEDRVDNIEERIEGRLDEIVASKLSLADNLSSSVGEAHGRKEELLACTQEPLYMADCG